MSSLSEDMSPRPPPLCFPVSPHLAPSISAAQWKRALFGGVYPLQSRRTWSEHLQAGSRKFFFFILGDFVCAKTTATASGVVRFAHVSKWLVRQDLNHTSSYFLSISEFDIWRLVEAVTYREMTFFCALGRITGGASLGYANEMQVQSHMGSLGGFVKLPISVPFGLKSSQLLRMRWQICTGAE